MGTLRIFVDRFLEGDTLDAGAIVDIVPYDVSEPITTPLTDLLVPAGEEGTVTARAVELPAGKYIIQARIPSGELISETAEITGGETKTVSLRPESSTNEWLSWQTHHGDAPSSEQLAREFRVVARRGPQEPLSADPVPTDPDDLTELKGVGPVIAKKLNQRGIKNYDQIARLSTKQAQWLREQVPLVRGRMEKYGWVKRAEELSMDHQRTPELWPTDAYDDAPDQEAPRVPGIVLRQPKDSSAFYCLMQRARRDNISDLGLHSTTVAYDFEPFLATGLEQSWQRSSDIHRCALRSELLPSNAVQCERDRIYMFVDDGFHHWTTTLPTPWHSVQRSRFVGLDITINQASSSDSGVNVLPRDPHFAPLLAYIRSGDTRAAKAILESAKQSLFEKIRNPYAAMAGAIVLINDLRWGGDRSTLDANWFNWIENLSNWNTWSPDAAVLHAWLRLLTDPEAHEEALGDLVDATHRGLPTYTACLQLLLEGLKLFRDDEERFSCFDGGPNLKLLEFAALRVDTRRVFTTIRISSRQGR